MQCKRQRTPEQRRLLVEEIERRKADGVPVSITCRRLGVPENTYYGWKAGKGAAKVSPSPEPEALVTFKNPFHSTVLVGAGL
jgi:transposase-like protein